MNRKIFTAIRRGVSTTSSKKLTLISVPINLGQPLLGPDLTPSYLLDGGLLDLLHTCGWNVNQVPPIISSTDEAVEKSSNDFMNAKNCREVGVVCEKLFHLTSNHMKEIDNFVLTLGGDHCLPIGTIPAIKKNRPNTGIVWVDAHADINTPEASRSGNIHGMPLGFLLGHVKDVDSLPNFKWFTPCLIPQDIVYIGLRDIDPYEKDVLKRLRIKAFSMYDVDKIGIGGVMQQCVEYFKGKDLHLSFDIDAIDPFFAPHTGTAVRGGLTFREANFICESLAATGRLRSMELVEVNPAIHTNIPVNTTIEMALTLIGSSLGQTIL